MNVHKNARLTPLGRERIVRQVASGQTPEAVAEAAGVCPRTVRKWVDRYRREGSVGCRIAHPGRTDCTGLLPRRLSTRLKGCAASAGLASRLPLRPAYRQRRSAEFCVGSVMANQRKESAVAFLEAAVAYYAKLAIRIERVMTDNGSCYRSTTFRAACKRLGLRQIFTKPYTPRTNGKAERFIQTALREWAYARAYQNSQQRSAELPHWLHRYNWHRPHASLKAKTPISRLGLSEDNLLRLHI
jgi:transposase InsO family protein